MRILSIGNSFSQDAHRWLHRLAESCGVDLETVNLYIAGCNLEIHWRNMVENNALYSFEPNGGGCERKVSIAEALSMEKWDAVTLQQSSPLSGVESSLEPYLSELAKVIREAQPDAKLYFHQTWAYEIDSGNRSFNAYNNNQRQMFECIVTTSEKAGEILGAPLIRSGTVIQYLRENVPEFDYRNGGLSLCRDGFHLSLDYGRFAAAATWLATLTGKAVNVVAFEDFDNAILSKITEAVNFLCLDESR